MKPLSSAHADLKSVVTRNFPALWPQLHANLTAIASLCWHDSPLPIALISVGPSGSGKTEPLMWIARSNHEILLRIDSFSPAAFVSHAANRKKSDLEKIDLLPQMRNRCLMTKELAPLFAGREDELRRSFAQLTSILDGEGLVTSSGSQGTRGYEEKIMFTWLGATTPPSKQVFNLMSALGTRLFFFSTDSTRPSAHDYAKSLCMNNSDDHSQKVSECQTAVKEFLDTLINTHPTKSKSINDITITDSQCSYLGVLCEALTRLRGGVSLSEGDNGDDRYSAPSIEHGWRASIILKTMACSSALIRGNTHIDIVDIDLVRTIVFSSMFETRRKLFTAILHKPHHITAREAAQAAGMSKKTALRYLKEFRILGVVTQDSNKEPFIYSLCSSLESLITHPYRETATDNIAVTLSGGVCMREPGDEPEEDNSCNIVAMK